MRFLMSFVILTLVIVYLIIPAVNWITKLFNKEVKRIDKALTKDNEKKDDVDNEY